MTPTGHARSLGRKSLTESSVLIQLEHGDTLYIRVEAMMVVRFAKWGNSLALRVPAALAHAIGAIEGGPADVAVEDGRLVVTPVSQPDKLDLAALVAAITDENTHDEIATGAPVGSEFW